MKPLREEMRQLEQPYRDRLLPAKYKEFPENVQIAIRTPEAQRTPGQVLLAGADDPYYGCLQPGDRTAS